MLCLVYAGCALLPACGGGSGGDTSSAGPTQPATAVSAGGTGSSASAITALKSDATLKKIDLQPFPANIRAKADAKVPELAQLVALGSSAVEDILNEFRRPPGLTDDVELSLLAYALEKIGDTQNDLVCDLNLGTGQL